MRVLFFLFLFSVTSVRAQPSGKRPPKTEPGLKEVARNNYYRSCVHVNRFSARRRALLYPFNQADSIVFASYLAPEEEQSQVFCEKVGIKVPEFAQRKVVSKAQTEELSDVIFNYGYRGKFDFETELLCDIPTNAILFYRKGRVFEFIELSFPCEQYHTGSHKVNLGTTCIGKYRLLKQLFVKLGLSTGP
jgi:hypothetical protein